MNQLALKGIGGKISWSYHTAAQFNSWAIERIGQGYDLTATVSTADTFRLSQRPLVFIAPHAKGVWRFNVIELQVSGASLTAKLGPLETQNAVTHPAS